MSKFLSFLNRHLTKILWTSAILVWIGVGIYYCLTSPNCYLSLFTLQNFVNDKIFTPLSQKINPPTPTPTPTFSEKLEEAEFITGNFVKWEEIEGSADKYIVLTDSQTKQVFPKIRIGFEFSALFGDGESKDITVFAVEKDDEEYDVLYALKYFTDEEIDKLIKGGDSIKIYLKKKLDKMENEKDENDNLLAHWLLIKREGGKQEVEQEIGREIQKPEI